MHLSGPQAAFLLGVARDTIRRALGGAPVPATAPLAACSLPEPPAFASVFSEQAGPDVCFAPAEARPLVPMPQQQPALDPALLQPAGCFVTLHELTTRRLRGCIGRLDASQPLLATVENMAQAVLDDPRFTHQRIRLPDLPLLEIEITVLSPLQPAEHVLAFDPLQHGVYLTIDSWSGCFLPQVARETGWNREQLLSRLCTEKLGLPPQAWQDPRARLQTFTALILGPEPFQLP